MMGSGGIGDDIVMRERVSERALVRWCFAWIDDWKIDRVFGWLDVPARSIAAHKPDAVSRTTYKDEATASMGSAYTSIDRFG